MKSVKISEDDYDRIFIISDIHGHFNLFKKMLEKIDLKKLDLLIIDGDSCDRGDNTYEVYDEILQLKEKEFNIIHIMGNHEIMFLDYITGHKNLETWILNGGGKTLRSYLDRPSELKDHIDYISNMPFMVECKNFLIVHAGIEPDTKIEEQTEWDLVWIRDKFIKKSINVTDKEIIFGHTVTPDGKINYYDNNTIDINCGVISHDTLGCLEIKTKNEYYVTSEE